MYYTDKNETVAFMSGRELAGIPYKIQKGNVFKKMARKQ